MQRCGMILGYGRVSTTEQDVDPQVSELKKAGAEKIFAEKASGGRWDRPELHRMLGQLREGDCVLVWKLDRISRSLIDLLSILRTIEEAGATFRSLTEPVDTSTAGGRMMMQIVGAFAEYERGLIRERTRVGLAAAKRAGKTLGRPQKLTTEQKRAARDLLQGGQKSQSEIARIFGVHPSTISRLAGV